MEKHRCDLLKKGIRWRVGDGGNILIYEDIWLLRATTFQIHSPKCLPEDLKVRALLLEGGKWNERLVCESFVPEEAKLILDIPLSQNPREDSVMWHYDKRGLFSAKSAYKLAFQMQRGSVASSSHGHHFVWKFLLNLKLPSKFKILSWKACKEFLPTRGLLYRRGIIAAPIVVLSVYGYCGLNGISGIMRVLVCLMKIHGIEQECITRAEPRSFFGFHSPLTQPQQQCWKRPPQSFFKLNVDAAMNTTTGIYASLGLTIRDDVGSPVMAAAIHMRESSSVAVAEAKALLEGIQIAAS